MLKPLGKFVESHSDIDVVAVTGDCFRWSNCEPLPDSWNTWPQRLKLSVPGNHDGKETFSSLRESEWDHRTPYISQMNDITFIGLDTSKDLRTGKDLDPKDSNSSEDYEPCSDFDSGRGFLKVKAKLTIELDESLFETGSALVILSHRWPQANKATRVWDFMQTMCGEHRPLLILCGHEHNRSSKRPSWSGPDIIRGVKCYRSQVYSEENTGNLITWDGNCFTCEPTKLW
jgi:hypothetical protein